MPTYVALRCFSCQVFQVGPGSHVEAAVVQHAFGVFILRLIQANLRNGLLPQSKQQTKVPKFNCSLCGAKQSVQRVYASSDHPKDIRQGEVRALLSGLSLPILPTLPFASILHPEPSSTSTIHHVHSAHPLFTSAPPRPLITPPNQRIPHAAVVQQLNITAGQRREQAAEIVAQACQQAAPSATTPQEAQLPLRKLSGNSRWDDYLGEDSGGHGDHEESEYDEEDSNFVLADPNRSTSRKRKAPRRQLVSARARQRRKGVVLDSEELDEGQMESSAGGGGSTGFSKFQHQTLGGAAQAVPQPKLSFSGDWGTPPKARLSDSRAGVSGISIRSDVGSSDNPINNFASNVRSDIGINPSRLPPCQLPLSAPAWSAVSKMDSLRPSISLPSPKPCPVVPASSSSVSKLDSPPPQQPQSHLLTPFGAELNRTGRGSSLPMGLSFRAAAAGSGSGLASVSVSLAVQPSSEQKLPRPQRQAATSKAIAACSRWAQYLDPGPDEGDDSE